MSGYTGGAGNSAYESRKPLWRRLPYFEMLIGGLFIAYLVAAAMWPAFWLGSGGKGERVADRTVVLVSIDGFRRSYLSADKTPYLYELATSGVVASMRPSFPSITFPNHYTLATGVRPDKHGIVSYRFKEGGSEFGAGATDAKWWNKAKPIWLTAEEQGVRTATAMWPGSDSDMHLKTAGRWIKFDRGSSSAARVDALRSLLPGMQERSATKPKFLMLYLDQVDHAGHRAGPDTTPTAAALRAVDDAVKALISSLPGADVVIVSDHGMDSISEAKVIDLAPAVAAGAGIIWDGPFAGIEREDAKQAAVEEQLIGDDAKLPGLKGHGQCWRKADVPKQYGYGGNARIPPIVCLANQGWQFASDKAKRPEEPYIGDHGFDPSLAEMEAVFIAHGPSFRSGASLAKFDNVSVYPLVAKLLGITPEANDGSLTDTNAARLAP